MLAIVIPYYKIDFFNNCLDSLVNQTDSRFNVYIGDDASPNSPKALLKTYSTSLSFEYKRFDKNLGGDSLTQQWHRCLDMLQEEPWVLVLGDDDVLGPNVVASFYRHIDAVETNNVSVIRYATRVIDETGKCINDKVYTHPELEGSIAFLMRKLKGGTRSSLSEFVFKANVLLEKRFKDLPLAWYSDYLAVLECSQFDMIYTINTALVYFRHSHVNITSGNKEFVKKNTATFNFYYYLLKEKSEYFDNSQKTILRNQLERTFLDNKKQLSFWRQLSVLYLSSGKIVSYISFIFKAIESLVQQKNTRR